MSYEGREFIFTTIGVVKSENSRSARDYKARKGGTEGKKGGKLRWVDCQPEQTRALWMEETEYEVGVS